jgi:hypothetical protein
VIRRASFLKKTIATIGIVIPYRAKFFSLVIAANSNIKLFFRPTTISQQQKTNGNANISIVTDNVNFITDDINSQSKEKNIRDLYRSNSINFGMLNKKVGKAPNFQKWKSLSLEEINQYALKVHRFIMNKFITQVLFYPVHS